MLLLLLALTAAEPMQPGRYQIIINPTVRADTFLLDTLTGRVWIHVCIDDARPATPTACEKTGWVRTQVEGLPK